jgi:hypothetical protein
MFIVEKRGIKRSSPYNRENPYVWDRTFYICKSERIDGKPKRIKLGQFKNAESLLHAVEIEKTNLQKHIENIGFWKANSFGQRWTEVKAHIEQQIENLTAWSHLLPNWKPEELKPVPHDLWPIRKKKTSKPKERRLVEDAYELFKKMNVDEQIKFMSMIVHSE